MIGYKTRTASARGQQSTNRISHRSSFILSFHFDSENIKKPELMKKGIPSAMEGIELIYLISYRRNDIYAPANAASERRIIITISTMEGAREAARVSPA